MDGRNNLEGENMKYMRHYLWFVLIDGIFSITDSRAKKGLFMSYAGCFYLFCKLRCILFFQAKSEKKQPD